MPRNAKNIMFTTDEIYAGIKRLAQTSPVENLTHCQTIDYHIKTLGFDNRHHLKSYLNSLSRESVHNIATKLFKEISTLSSPTLDCSYYVLWHSPDFPTYEGVNLGAIDEFIGFDKNFLDVCVPQPIDGKHYAQLLREGTYSGKNETVYIIETHKLLKLWLEHEWGGYAIISSDVMQSSLSCLLDLEKYVVEDFCPEKAQKVIDMQLTRFWS
ncbi:hypothetical protein H735_04385 [Vibrio owensii CAIM 1854 = LMG 25443]|uniref:Uncharacterized protein n=2 Tax=Vibrio owensii TaxID=696485 RepID=A0A0C1ZAY0_9VIBR|nr:hypothetical protein H735_04385 [Vibrio owensii CAIM 1854 = LMG 25443]